jgi:transposase-like protein
MVAAAIRTIFDQPDAPHLHEQLDVIAGMLGRQFPKLETMLRDAAEELLAFTAFPPSHWKKVWSTNPLERLNKGAGLATFLGDHGEQVIEIPRRRRSTRRTAAKSDPLDAVHIARDALITQHPPSSAAAATARPSGCY